MDAPGAAGEELGAGDLSAGLDGLFDGGLIRLAGGFDREPGGIEGLLVVDHDGRGLAAAELVIREREVGGAGLQLGEDKHKRFLQRISPARITTGQIGEPLGLLTPVGGLAAQVLDHPAGGIGFGGEGLGSDRRGLADQLAGGRLADAQLGGDEQQLLELFDGGGLTSLRIAGDRIYTRSQVSIYGSTQPEVLRELVAKGDASGLWARFLFVPLPPRAIALPRATTPAEEANVEAAAGTLAKACRTIYKLTPATYRLGHEATDLFVGYEYQRQRAAQEATIGAQSALYGKSAGKVLRVAGVLHLLHLAAGDAAKEGCISAGCIERATALVDHLDAWALGLSGVPWSGVTQGGQPRRSRG